MDCVKETPSIIFKFKTRLIAESAMSQGKTWGERQLAVTWYTQTLPGKEGDEVSQEGGELLDQEEPEDDGYTPPQEDYLPPGLQVVTVKNYFHFHKFSYFFHQEHEDSLSRDGASLSASGAASETAETEELNENLLDDDEDEDEEDEDEERSWKRKNNDDEP